MQGKNTLIPSEYIAQQILLIRGYKVILDTDLAKLYGVTTKRLNEQVKRNIERFPVDFIFQLTNDEKIEVVANCDHLASLKFSHTHPYAFTEHGTIMAASILNSPKAIEVSVLVVRTFVKLRQMLNTHTEMRHKLIELEERLDSHDQNIQELINTIRHLMEANTTNQKNPIGFAQWKEDKSIKTA